MPTLALDHLDAHPANANRMPEALFDKLVAHIKRSGDYPPLIVRHHPQHPDRFEILDGHHRARALMQLGYDAARCEIWDADDRRAALLLLTLNRLHGQDDPQARGKLLEQLHAQIDLDELASMLPDSRQQIRALIDLTHAPPPTLPEPPSLEQMPEALTFFLPAAARAAVLERLRSIHQDRVTALLAGLGIQMSAAS